MTDLINAFTRYRIERAKIRAAQRQELDQKLVKFARDLGDAIIQERESGHTIEDIQFSIGLKNKTFIYDMIRAGTPEPVAAPTPAEAEPEPEYEIAQIDEDKFEVTVGGRSWIVYLQAGALSGIPDEWAEGTKAKRAVYTKIISAIEHNTK